MGKWSIGRMEFASKEDYKAACRDLKRIQALAAGVELDDFKEAAELYDMLKKQPFLFESELGRAFRGYLNDKANGILHPRGSFPEECLHAGRPVKKKKPAQPEAESFAKAKKDANNAMRAGREKLRERDIGRKREEQEPANSFYGAQNKRHGAGKAWEEEPFRSGPAGRYTERKTLAQTKGLNESDEFDDILDDGIRRGKEKQKRRGKKRAAGAKKRGSFLKVSLIIAGLCLILFALYKIFSYDILSYISERKMEELASCILTPIEPEVSEAHRIADLIASGLYTEQEAIEIARSEQQENPMESITEDGILYRYSVLYARNSDMAGWIQLAGTVINYPVMLTPQEEEYYLQKGFDKKYDINGIPFMDIRCSVEEPTLNFLIYGHNMKNGSMFSALLSYEQEEFYKEHPTIRFDTIYARGEYEIVGVFRTQVPYESDKETYRYYSFIDTQDEEEYNDYIRYVKEQSFYETGITAEFGTQLLTLSTCDRSVEAGRFVVVARKK